jgi:hypothetical protein
MSRGELRCIGSSKRLKDRFGHGYEIVFHCEGANPQEQATRAQSLHDCMAKEFPRMEHVETFAGTLIFRCSKEHMIISRLFRYGYLTGHGRHIAHTGALVQFLQHRAQGRACRGRLGREDDNT